MRNLGYILVGFVIGFLMYTVCHAGLWQRGDDVRDLNDDGPWLAQGFAPVQVDKIITNIVTTIVTNGDHQAWLDWWAGAVGQANYVGWNGSNSLAWAASGVALTATTNSEIISGIHQDRENMARMYQIGDCPQDLTITTQTVENITVTYKPRVPQP